MDSFELNKVLGALLGTCLALLSINIAAGSLFASHEPEKPGFEIAVKEEAPSKPGEQAPAEEPLPQRLAEADVKRGEAATKVCQACHTFGKGEPNRVGPNLYGVVGRPKHSEAGFNYSGAMKGQTGEWSPEELDKYLTNPRGVVPGTNMTFAGLPRGKQRADVIAYLNSNSDKPVAFPKAAAAPAPEKQAASPGGNDKDKPAAKPAAEDKPAAKPAEEDKPAAK